MQNTSVTLMHNRSLAEQILYKLDGEVFNGFVDIENGKLNSTNLTVEGNSLLIGADLTGKAFTRSIFGEYGQYIVAIGLLLFAFSTAIAWSYYGDRATVHLFEGWVLYYRIIYVGAFFTCSNNRYKNCMGYRNSYRTHCHCPQPISNFVFKKRNKKT